MILNQNLFSDETYFPKYVTWPVDYWLHACDRLRIDVEMYSYNFLQTFEKSYFFKMCKTEVEGKLQWGEWNDCSVSCGSGIQLKIATACIPEYVSCRGIQILEQSCNENDCPDMPSSYLPARV